MENKIFSIFYQTQKHLKINIVFPKKTNVFDFGKKDLAFEIDVSVLPGIKLIFKCCLSYTHALLSLNRSFKIKMFCETTQKVTF